MQVGLIYCVTNKINGKKYIGQTVRRFSSRKYQHIFDSKKNDAIVFHKALRKYGLENFLWEVLENNIDIKILNEVEIKYIKEHESFKNGYNMTEGGGGIYGLKKSEESKIKVSNALKGKKKSEEHIRNLIKSRQEHPDTPETTLKKSLSHKGKKHTQEHKDKVSKALKNRIFTTEHKKKLSEKARLRIITVDQKQKMSNTMKNLDKYKYRYKDQYKSLVEYAKDLGVRPNLLQQRIMQLGWSIEKAIETPIATCGRKKGYIGEKQHTKK